MSDDPLRKNQALESLEKTQLEESFGRSAIDYVRQVGRQHARLGLLVAAALLIGGVVVATRDGDKTTAGTPAGLAESLAPSGSDWFVEDPIGDWEAFGGLNEIVDDRTADGVNAGEAKAAADLVGFDASSSGGNTELNLRFAGDAQGVQEFARSDLSGGAEFRFPDGTRREILFRNDGTVKMVDAPPGVTVTKEWVDNDHLRLFIDGMALDPGSKIEAHVILGIFDGTEQDQVGP